MPEKKILKLEVTEKTLKMYEDGLALFKRVCEGVLHGDFNKLLPIYNEEMIRQGCLANAQEIVKKLKSMMPLSETKEKMKNAETDNYIR